MIRGRETCRTVSSVPFRYIEPVRGQDSHKKVESLGKITRSRASGPRRGRPEVAAAGPRLMEINPFRPCRAPQNEPGYTRNMHFTGFGRCNVAKCDLINSRRKKGNYSVCIPVFLRIITSVFRGLREKRYNWVRYGGCCTGISLSDFEGYMG